MFSFRKFRQSGLYDQNEFYPKFIKDISHAKSEIIIESPFLSLRRARQLMSVLSNLVRTGVGVTINTRHPSESIGLHESEAQILVNEMLDLDISVFYTGKLHRKIAIIDRKILWEGSLNILSHSDSAEIMRRTDSEAECKQMLGFLGLYERLR